MLRISSRDEVIRFDLARSVPGRGSYWTTAYGVDGLLVDSGCAHTAEELLRALQGRMPSRIVNTHSHEDHIGANGLLQRRGAELEILAHPLAIPILASPRQAQPLQPYRRFFWGYPEPSRARPLGHAECLGIGRYAFRVLHTPGHSPDHLCLYEPDREWLFTGDLFVGGQDRALRADSDIWQILDSLRLVSDLPIKWLFPGCARARQNPRDELKAKIAYLEDLGARVLDLEKAGLEADAIACRLWQRPMPIELLTWGHFSRRHLVLSYLRGSPLLSEVRNTLA